MGRPGYPAEFRRKVLDLLAEGRSVASVAHDLDVGDQTIYNWRRQDRIDRGVVVTRGAEGAYAAIADDFDLLAVPPVAVSMGDTVGAGDSFMAGLISGLLAGGLLGSAAASQQLAAAGWHRVQPALHRAVLTSAITVSHTGAYAPPSTRCTP